MEYLIYIGLALFIAYYVLTVLTAYTAQIILVTLVIGFGWLLFRLVRAVSKWGASREANRQQNEAHQKFIHANLVSLCSASLNLFEGMPRHLTRAELALDQAEQDFNESAFAPFWDCIEQVAKQLGQIDNDVRTIAQNCKDYIELTNTYKGKGVCPKFPIVISSVRGMTATKTTADRMKAIVRNAHCNRDFAMIYQQIRTNKILIEGFGNLAEAINHLGERIVSSIDGLSDQISEMSASVNESLAVLNTTVQDLHSTVQKEMDGQAERHNKALEMLDNIQRRRRPTSAASGLALPH